MVRFLEEMEGYYPRSGLYLQYIRGKGQTSYDL